MRNSFNRVLSMLLCISMLFGVMPVSALASESVPSDAGENQQYVDSGAVPEEITVGQSNESEVTEKTGNDEPTHWLQKYQEWALSQQTSTFAMRSVFTSPPDTRKPRFLPAISSSS